MGLFQDSINLCRLDGKFQGALLFVKGYTEYCRNMEEKSMTKVKHFD